ncbi:ArsI/CadI family heavy metal resistance metalloenzyme [Hyphococcus luteus]|uniref:Glyoxalase/bleomycin resistance/dioxygenase family protein n=1 Tax=Hyphococcus luteus TaxID=2058213 RepID=A0A2S7K674_9PROT|nr:ArsI/CadI family heavy metal resistance metalloenzyme [Marinicaulis flavus]PQA87997.1 glyoxalase/bleomycin resistance/dioxygenase family protein [Marinicaulis flavus]
MKRLHIHIRTDDLEGSIRYYAALFGAEPEKRKHDYARWLLDDPAVNLAVSSRGGSGGVDHLGISLDDNDGLEAIAARLRDKAAPVAAEDEATCCYARSDKYWSHDPQGAVWELFHTYGDSETFGEDFRPAPQSDASGACCGA